jgi:hypothetical protein
MTTTIKKFDWLDRMLSLATAAQHGVSIEAAIGKNDRVLLDPLMGIYPRVANKYFKYSPYLDYYLLLQEIFNIVEDLVDPGHENDSLRRLERNAPVVRYSNLDCLELM